VLHDPRHAYTRLLISEHEQYGLERFVDAEPGNRHATREARDAC
jgi:hypothetical protein